MSNTSKKPCAAWIDVRIHAWFKINQNMEIKHKSLKAAWGNIHGAEHLVAFILSQLL